MSAVHELRAEGLAIDLGGRRVLDGINADFARGRLIAIVGPNGAGKSTLLACLAGLLRPGAGAVRLEETTVLALSARQRARRIAFLAQTPEIAWDIDVRAFVGSLERMVAWAGGSDVVVTMNATPPAATYVVSWAE